ncbi:unnamed protein product [Didymodactylos carnosus]|uniref:GST C-terminal domain-containing protein n=1 Tax=Didymodactylos carnosus TaxID=1234261 RepID=A0A815W1F1_9BILA|nr:unnamed protein product [Didymodactylos carnosus]CAF1537674.1 unnamed protein product [Didymodactylos carnosus]CAF4211132.1 unnamed protein product [Didymodactylos carnosus]CAF4397669.1 unnamed protein product [Didymodactylos carnosus]
MNDLTDKFTQKYFELKDETAKAQGKHQLLTTDIPKVLGQLEKLHSMYSENGFSFVGNQLTWADLLVYDSITNLLTLDSYLLEPYPKLRQNRQDVENHPKINAYLKSRPVTAF